MLNIAVFGSGAGSNFRSILTAIQQGNIPGARISLVLSNNSGAGILGIARANALPAIHLSRKQFPDEPSFADAVLSALRAHGVNFIALAGYMKQVPAKVVAAYRNRIVNIHPALLPRFGGAGMFGIHVHEAVIASGATTSGATVHYVDEDYDHGPVVLQKEVPVLPGDSPASLAARVLEAEHELYPAAIRQIAENEKTAGHNCN
ncbi:MAG TPA: phosphoribosylglycinamide formyltransferase [Bacteroidota bacterium]|nr:phosphoribosylglycinamide formyltransferase [Bacteroidota bacterium]